MGFLCYICLGGTYVGIWFPARVLFNVNCRFIFVIFCFFYLINSGNVVIVFTTSLVDIYFFYLFYSFYRRTYKNKDAKKICVIFIFKYLFFFRH
jgi:hypothetical protein